MDPQIEELKELVRQNIALSQENYRLIHKMRRGMWWGRLGTMVFWLILIVAPVAAYYYYFQSYIQPYTQKLEQMYTQYQQGNQQVQNYQSQLSNFFGNLMPSTTTPNAPQVPQGTQ